MKPVEAKISSAIMTFLDGMFFLQRHISVRIQTIKGKIEIEIKNDLKKTLDDMCSVNEIEELDAFLTSEVGKKIMRNFDLLNSIVSKNLNELKEVILKKYLGEI